MTAIPKHVLDRLNSPVSKDGQVWSFCKCHPDGTKKGRRSLAITVKDGKLLWHCYAGCSQEDVAKALGLNRRKQVSSRRKKIEAIYQYLDTSGNVLLEVVRYFKPGGGKEFRQRQPDGNGGHIWNTKGVRPLIYNLPKGMKAIEAGETIFVVEGEKCADRLAALGLTATCSPGGAGKWKKHHSVFLKGAHVVILPDRDEPGERHAQAVAMSLQGVAQEVRILHLPGLPDKGDIVDWFEAGGTKKELLELAAKAPIAEIKSGASDDKQNEQGTDLSRARGSIIHTDRGQLWQLTEQILQALVEANSPPSLFERLGALVRIRLDETNPPRIELMTEDSTKGCVTRCAHFMKRNKNGELVDARPPSDAVRDLLALPERPFPPLQGIVETPIVRPNGTVVDKSGYDPETRLYLHFQKEFTPPQLPDSLTERHAEQAVQFIYKEVFQDFPFDSDASLANIFGLLLTPLIRHAIQGLVPLALVDSPQSGTGKSMLANLVSLIPTGRDAGMTAAPEALRGDDEAEWRKRITSLLIAGTPVVIIDNIDKPLRSPSLASVLTSSVWCDRVMGHSKMVFVPNRSTWIATGNNLKAEGDLPRRCYQIRLDAQMPRPFLRQGFRHKDLPAWVRDNRPNILSALLAMTKAWFCAGRPGGTTVRFGTFDQWADTVGSILEFSGVSGFLSNLEAFLEQTSTEENEWSGFLENWQAVFGDTPQTINELCAKIYPDDHKLLPDALESLRESMPPYLQEALQRSLGSFKRKLGRAFLKRVGMRFPNGLYIEKAGQDVYSKVVRWRVRGVLREQNPQTEPFDSISEKSSLGGYRGFVHSDARENLETNKEGKGIYGGDSNVGLLGQNPNNPSNPRDSGGPRMFVDTGDDIPF